MADMPSGEQKTEIQFDMLIKKSLSTERKNFFRDLGRQRKREFLFSELSEGQIFAFEDSSALDAFSEVEMVFQVMQYSIAVQNSLLYEALLQIEERARNIILLAFWNEMTDQEIADETGINRRTVNSIRNKTYAKLRKILGDNGYDENKFFRKDRQ